MKKTMYTHAPFQFTHHQQPYDLHGDAAAAAKSIAIISLSCQALAGLLASTLVTSRFGQQPAFDRGILIKKAGRVSPSGCCFFVFFIISLSSMLNRTCEG
jgi:hypothetical protein